TVLFRAAESSETVHSGMLRRVGSFICKEVNQLTSAASTRWDVNVSSASPRDLGVVLLVRDVLEPGDVLAVEMFLQRDVHHRGVGTGAVPVLFSGRDPHGVAGADFPHWAAPQGHPPDAGDDVQGLADRMG